MKELKDTVENMTSDNYADRFIAEYDQAKIRREKLKAFADKIELAEVYHIGTAPEHKCPLNLLREQLRAMESYLSILEKRAIIEGISLS